MRVRVTRLEDRDGKASDGGVIVFIDDNEGKHHVVRLEWFDQLTPIDPHEGAKHYATVAIDVLMKRKHGSVASEINWNSVRATMQRIILDWNERLQRALQAEMARQADTGESLEIKLLRNRRTLQ